MDDRDSSPPLSPRTEPWMIQGLKLMEQERRTAAINRIRLIKEKMLLHRQAYQEACTRALYDVSASSAESMEDSEDEFPASQLRYMERKQLRERGFAPNPPMRQRSAFVRKINAGGLLNSGTANASASAATHSGVGPSNASAEPGPMAVTDAMFGGAGPVVGTSEGQGDEENLPETFYVNPNIRRSVKRPREMASESSDSDDYEYDYYSLRM